MEEIGLYLRNSTEDQKRQHTEENQIHDLRAWLGTLPVHFEDSDIYVDLAKSGGNPGRKQFNLLLSRLDRYQAVAVWDADRLVRDEEMGLELALTLRRRGLRLYEYRTRKVYDLNNFADLFMHINFMLMSAEEKAKARDRRNSGMLRKMRSRGAPAGVELTHENLSRYYPHRPKKPINWQLYDKAAAAGLSHRGIARLLGVHRDTLAARLKEREGAEE